MYINYYEQQAKAKQAPTKKVSYSVCLSRAPLKSSLTYMYQLHYFTCTTTLHMKGCKSSLKFLVSSDETFI